MMDNINDKLRVVGEFDGWEYKDLPIRAIKTTKDSEGLERTKAIDTRSFDYHTNIATLWPVAKKVCEGLNKLVDALDVKLGIDPPIKDVLMVNEVVRCEREISAANNTYIPGKLFEAVYSAITLLNKHKNGQV